MDKMFGINQSLKGLFRNTELLTNELKKIKLPDEGSAGSTDINLIRFGVEPVGGGSPLEIQEKFSPLAEHLSKKTGQKVVLKVVSDYEGILRDIEQGITQFCFVSPVTYIIAKKKYGTQVIAKALIEGKSAYRSVIVTKSASRINSLEDIRGRKFAFGDPHSLSSYIAPRKMLLNAGIDLKDLLHYEYLGSHEAVADAVLSGNFDAGGITESTANKFKDKGIKFIQFSENLPGFIICASKTIPQGMKESLEIALTALSDTRPESSAILHSIYKRYSGFEKAYDIEFAQLESMMSQLGLP
jgi:phosphonate transport system substrate-binding protein